MVILIFISFQLTSTNGYWCRIHLWFRLMGVLQAKSITSQRYRAVTRWRICVTMATLWQQQDGGYALLWKRYDKKCITSSVYDCTVEDVEYSYNKLSIHISNSKSTVIDWTCYRCILHLQQYSHRLNLLYIFMPYFLWLSSVPQEKYRHRTWNQDKKTSCHVTPGRDGIALMAAGMYSGCAWFEYR